ncbi:MAG: hypothetical protein Q3983_04075 [Capnocytophaga sp.]|nr:hypothetical protein [Capnocytophaga sp.]
MPNEVFFNNQVDFEWAIFGRSSYSNYYHNTGFPFGNDLSYKSIGWVKILFRADKKPKCLTLFLKKDPTFTDSHYKDFYYTRKYFYKYGIIHKIFTEIKEVNGATYRYTETYELLSE